MQLVDNQTCHLLDLVGRRQPRGELSGDTQLGAQVGQLAGSGHQLHARVSAVAAQRLGTPLALARGGSARGPPRGANGLNRELRHR